MKKIDAFKNCMISLILIGPLAVVLTMIIAVRIYPDGQSENKLINILLKRITIQTVIEDDKWSEKYPYENSASFWEQYQEKTAAVKKSLESYCTVSFPGSERINMVVTGLKEHLYHYKLDEISGIYENIVYVEKCADNVAAFRDSLQQKGYPFLYVQTPSPDSVQYYRGTALQGDSLTIPERSYAFIGMLEDENINVINMISDHTDDISFDNSLHWMPENGLSCAALIARELNTSYHFSIDENIYSPENFYDLLSVYPEQKESILQNCGYDFSVPVPKNDPQYQIVYAEETAWNGSFLNAMIYDADAWDLEGGPYHNIFRLSNSLIFEITNEDAAEDKKILVIGDSFNWPVSAYLSLGVRNVTIIHNASFTGSLLNYIEKMNPDIVIMVYNDAEFSEIFTKDAFYLQ